MTSKFDKESKAYSMAKETSLSLVYVEDRKEKTLDIIAQTADDYETWCTALEKNLLKLRAAREATALTTRFLRHTFEIADKSSSKYKRVDFDKPTLTVAHITSLLPELSIPLSNSRDLADAFLQAGPVGGKLNLEGFFRFISVFRRRYFVRNFLFSRNFLFPDLFCSGSTLSCYGTV